MLAGTKPAAMFYDIFPSVQFLGLDQFATFVASGQILMREAIFASRNDPCFTHYVFYALPSEAWRLQRLEELARIPGETPLSDYDALDREMGQLLGYPAEAINYFLSFKKNRKKN